MTEGDEAWTVVGKGKQSRRRQLAMQSVVAEAVKAALFTFGRGDAKRPGRRPQWTCGACSWENDMRRLICRHCGCAKDAPAPG
eukprot:3367396-Karenia_brevis.AAC.1